MSGKSQFAVRAASLATWAKHPDVLKYVQDRAAENKSQRTIAAALGKNIRTLEEAMAKDKGDNPLRLAYEAGRAKAEQNQIDACANLKPTDPKTMVAWIFFMKAQFAWRDKPDISSPDAPRITFVLPGSLSEAEYLAKCGITEPIDTRPVNQRGLLGGMKDVTPGADGKLPTKVEAGSHRLTAEAVAATQGRAPAAVIQERVRALTTPSEKPFAPDLTPKNPGP